MPAISHDSTFITILNDNTSAAAAKKQQRSRNSPFSVHSCSNSHTSIITELVNLARIRTNCSYGGVRCPLSLHFICWSVTNFWWPASEETAPIYTQYINTTCSDNNNNNNPLYSFVDKPILYASQQLTCRTVLDKPVLACRPSTTSNNRV